MRRATGLIITIMTVSLTGPAIGENLLNGSWGGAFNSQLDALDRRADTQNSNAVSLSPQTVKTGQFDGNLEYDDKTLGVDWGINTSAAQLGRSRSYSSNYRGPFLDIARSAARRYNIPEDLFLKLVQQESGWRPDAISRAGAIGLAQLMPGTAHELGVTDPWDPHQNLNGGARYLREQYQEFQSWKLALAAYNAGPAAVRRHGGVPPYSETRNYVRIIWGS